MVLHTTVTNEKLSDTTINTSVIDDYVFHSPFFLLVLKIEDYPTPSFVSHKQNVAVANADSIWTSREDATEVLIQVSAKR